MISDFPRSYRVVRKGRWQTACVSCPEELASLRTELEIVRRFGAGATPALVAVLDARSTRAWTDEVAAPAARERLVQDLGEMREILCDAMAPANARAIEEIDRDYPELQTRLPMDSIKKDTEQFRQDVTEQAKAAEELANDADVDAMLAAFEQATVQADETETPAVAPPTDSAVDDATVAAMLAEVSQAAQAAEANVPPYVVDTNGLPDETDAVVTDPVELAMAELAASAVETTEPAAEAAEPVTEMTPSPTTAANPTQADAGPDAEADVAAGLETVSQQVAESLTHAEQQLDAIASAFDVAAAELGQMTVEVQHVGEQAPDASCESDADAADAQPTDAEDAATLAAWDEDVASPAAPPLPETYDTGFPPVSRTGEVPVSHEATQRNVTPGSMNSTANVKSQIQNARSRILSELDEVLAVVERVDQMQAQADQSLERAQRFEKAAARAHEAGQSLAEAEAEAAKARATFEQAQLQVSSARNAWEQARQEAATAAAASQPRR